jgi:hypothetical protein
MHANLHKHFQMRHMDQPFRVAHKAQVVCLVSAVQEIALMKYVSRDANLVQFYGACIHGDSIMLVMEFLEARRMRGCSAPVLPWDALPRDALPRDALPQDGMQIGLA